MCFSIDNENNHWMLILMIMITRLNVYFEDNDNEIKCLFYWKCKQALNVSFNENDNKQ